MHGSQGEEERSTVLQYRRTIVVGWLALLAVALGALVKGGKSNRRTKMLFSLLLLLSSVHGKG